MLIFFSSSHWRCTLFMLAQEKAQRPCVSPRSIEIVISFEPG